MSKKIRVRYTVHSSTRTIDTKSSDFVVSDSSAEELLLSQTPASRSDFSGFNLKTALYWTARLMDCFFDPNDQILSIKEVKK